MAAGQDWECKGLPVTRRPVSIQERSPLGLTSPGSILPLVAAVALKRDTKVVRKLFEAYPKAARSRLVGVPNFYLLQHAVEELSHTDDENYVSRLEYIRDIFIANPDGIHRCVHTERDAADEAARIAGQAAGTSVLGRGGIPVKTLDILDKIRCNSGMYGGDTRQSWWQGEQGLGWALKDFQILGFDPEFVLFLLVKEIETNDEGFSECLEAIRKMLPPYDNIKEPFRGFLSKILKHKSAGMQSESCSLASEIVLVCIQSRVGMQSKSCW